MVFSVGRGVNYIPYLQLSHEVHAVAYGSVIGLGMVLSGLYWNQFGRRFHAMRWTDAAQLAARQMVVVAFMSFGLAVVTKDAAISRLFLGHFY
jgi:hypothetical protein